MVRTQCRNGRDIRHWTALRVLLWLRFSELFKDFPYDKKRRSAFLRCWLCDLDQTSSSEVWRNYKPILVPQNALEKVPKLTGVDPGFKMQAVPGRLWGKVFAREMPIASRRGRPNL